MEHHQSPTDMTDAMLATLIELAGDQATAEDRQLIDPALVEEARARLEQQELVDAVARKLAAINPEIAAMLAETDRQVDASVKALEAAMATWRKPVKH
jgi:hypothetical protein